MKMNIQDKMTKAEILQYARNFMNSVSVHMSLQTFMKLQYFIAQCGPEISGLGPVRRRDDNTFFVDDIFIVEQTVTGGFADPWQGIHKLVEELAAKDMDDYIASLKFSWHSHADMTTFFSPQIDLATIDRWKRGGMDWMISFVGNHAGQYLARLDIFQPFHLPIERIPVMVDLPIDPEMLHQCANEIRTKVKMGFSARVYNLLSGNGVKKVRPAGGSDSTVSVDASMVGSRGIQQVDVVPEGGGGQ